ncbi:transposase [Lysinibacillus xylanilyticus]
MSKYTAEKKLQAVQRYLNGNESYKDIGQSIGANKKLIIIWVKQYEHNGLDAFIKRCTNYTQQFKLDVLKFMIENGTSLTETAATFNMPPPLFGEDNWKCKESMPFNQRKWGCYP